MSAYYLSVFVLVATVLSTFRTDQTRFEFSPNSPWAVLPYKTLHTNEMQTCTNDLIRLANGGSTDERVLSESSRSHILAYYLSVF